MSSAGLGKLSGVPRLTAGMSLYMQLRQMILDNSLKSGQRLRETELAAESGLSRTPVREALTLLRVEGLVDVSPSGATQVARLDREEDVREIYDLRIALESYAYGCAATRRTPDELEEIVSLAGHLQDLHGADGALVLQAHRSLEHVVLRAAHNPRLSEQCLLISDYPFMRAVLLQYPRVNVDQALRSQFDVVEAIRAGNGSEAESLRRQALEAAREIAVELVRAST